MKKFLVLLFVIISTVSLGQEVRYVNSVELNIRKGAGTEFPVISKVSKGEKVVILSDSNNWSQIETTDGRKGFVSSKYLNTSSDNLDKSDTIEFKGWGVGLAFGLLILISIIKVASKKTPNTGSKNVSRDREVKKANHWYLCKHCHQIIQLARSPSSFGCSSSSMHGWADLGEVGERNFLCKKCGAKVQTKKTPSAFWCSQGSMHDWYEQ